jgi:hypothetical protein
MALFNVPVPLFKDQFLKRDFFDSFNGPRYRRRVGLDSFAKRKNSKPEPIRFDGVNPAVLVHAVLGSLLWSADS